MQALTPLPHRSAEEETPRGIVWKENRSFSRRYTRAVCLGRRGISPSPEALGEGGWGMRGKAQTTAYHELGIGVKQRG